MRNFNHPEVILALMLVGWLGWQCNTWWDQIVASAQDAAETAGGWFYNLVHGLGYVALGAIVIGGLVWAATSL